MQTCTIFICNIVSTFWHVHGNIHNFLHKPSPISVKSAHLVPARIALPTNVNDVCLSHLQVFKSLIIPPGLLSDYGKSSPLKPLIVFCCLNIIVFSQVLCSWRWRKCNAFLAAFNSFLVFLSVCSSNRISLFTFLRQRICCWGNGGNFFSTVTW